MMPQVSGNVDRIRSAAQSALFRSSAPHPQRCALRKRRYAWAMKRAITGLALSLFVACGGLVTPGSEEQPGGLGPNVATGDTASAGGASQLGSAAGTSANSGTGLAPVQPPDAPGVSSGGSGGGPSATGASAEDSGSGPSGGSAGTGNASGPLATGAGAGGSVSSGSGVAIGGSVGVGFVSADGGLSGSASCPPSNGAPACPPLPAFLPTPGDVGTWPGCQYMACLSALCATCTCVASGEESTWECEYGDAQPVGSAAPAPPTPGPPPVLPAPPSPFMVPDASAPARPPRRR